MELLACRHVVGLVLIATLVWAREPKCSDFDYQEKLLTKTIRMEIGFESLFNKVKEMEENVNLGLTSLRDDRVRMTQELEAMIKEQHEVMNETVKKMEEIMQGMKTTQDERMKLLERSSMLKQLGATYTRWGRTVCPNDSTTVYTGFAAGSDYSKSGGPVETTCFPSDPQWSRYFSTKNTWTSSIYGTEYEAFNDNQLNAVFGKPLRDQDVPCAVCKATSRPAMLMIPARTECYTGWHLEYSGYLMSTHHSQVKASLLCIDAYPETITGGSANANGNILYFLEVVGQLPDPPYTRGKELTCVVCTQ